MKERVVLFWFRRDLRLNENHGLFRALESGFPVLPLFVFDKAILENFSSQEDARVSFIYDEVQRIKSFLEEKGSSLRIFHSEPLKAFEQLAGEYEIAAVYANKDYEPYALARDASIHQFLEKEEIAFRLLKDHVIFEENEITKPDGHPYTIFTPYSKKWKQRLGETEIPEYPSEKRLERLYKVKPLYFPQLQDLGFRESTLSIPGRDMSEEILSNYSKNRDYPYLRGTTRLGIHLRFGTVSIREVLKQAVEKSEVFLNELIWRDFYSGILWSFPHVVDKSFKRKYDQIEWRNNEEEFARWCSGNTGYPMVDAGMRELNATGFMHNRLRMVTASFLTKHLLIDWRWGEAYFAEKLLDYELASNNGGWQWAAGTGCDAAPYFRIFNPESQQKKFDPDGKYVFTWVPEYGTPAYPSPLVDHKMARERALNAYKSALG